MYFLTKPSKAHENCPKFGQDHDGSATEQVKLFSLIHAFFMTIKYKCFNALGHIRLICLHGQRKLFKLIVCLLCTKPVHTLQIIFIKHNLKIEKSKTKPLGEDCQAQLNPCSNVS